MSQQENEIFSKVSDQERLRLFKDLATTRTQLVCKGESDQIYYFVAERTNPRQELMCSLPFGAPAPVHDKDLVCNFFIGGERYFFRTLAAMEKESVILKTNTDLFHLQRRQNYRIKIPENYTSKFLITKLNLVPSKLSGNIYDLSSGGCRVVMIASSPILATGDKILGFISVGNRESLEVEGTVRHHTRQDYATKPTKQIFGVEFNSLSSILEGKLFAITMDLHREFFSRLNTKF